MVSGEDHKNVDGNLKCVKSRSKPGGGVEGTIGGSGGINGGGR